MSFRLLERGREYNSDEFLKEVLSLAKTLATHARLIDPLPANVDLSESEHQEVQSQVYPHPDEIIPSYC